MNILVRCKVKFQSSSYSVRAGRSFNFSVEERSFRIVAFEDSGWWRGCDWKPEPSGLVYNVVRGVNGHP
jgi:hypothetical protein